MLRRVLHELEAARGPVRFSELAQRLDIDQSTLEGMVAYWIRKGRLHDSALAPSEGCFTDQCSAGCVQGAGGGCPFVGKTPRTISLAGSASIPQEAQQH